MCFKYVHFLVLQWNKLIHTEAFLKEVLRRTWFPLSCRRATGEAVASPFMRLQSQKLPLILDNMTVVKGLHLQLHIPAHIPEAEHFNTFVTTTIMI